MAVYIIADLHLSFGTDKPMDIFGGWDNYLSKLEYNWKSIVKDCDTVIIPGDISWAMQLNNAVKDLCFIDALPGKKLLGKGNHDYWWNSIKKLQDFKESNGLKTIDFLFNNSFEVEDIVAVGTRGWQILGKKTDDDKKIMVREAGRLKLSLESVKKDNKKEIVAFFHYPPVLDDYVFEEIFDLMELYNINRCFFGHLHGKIPSGAECRNYRGIECRLVSADHLKFKPILLTQNKKNV